MEEKLNMSEVVNEIKDASEEELREVIEMIKQIEAKQVQEDDEI